MPHLVLASEAQKRERDVLAWQAWGQRLELAQFCAREDRLRATPWAREGMRTWLLVDGDAVLASCETFRMTSWVRGEPGETHGVASVFTEEPLRGRGYAGEMMRRLGEELGGAQASILFSDVGEALYARAGYAAVAGVDRIYPPVAGDPAKAAELLREGDLGAALAALPAPSRVFEIRPTFAQLHWHIERERCYADLLGLPRPAWHGARAGSATLLWCGNLKSGELVGLLYRAADPSAGAAVIEAARRVAGRAGLSRVVMWEHGEAQPWPDGGERVVRTESLPMVRPFAAFAPGEWSDTDRALWI